MGRHDFQNQGASSIDLSNTEIAFGHLSRGQLTRAILLFRLMHLGWLIDILSSITLVLLRWKVPGIRLLVKSTIYRQFVGGETLEETSFQIDKLWRYNILSALDYGAEGKSLEEDLDQAHSMFLKAIRFAANHLSVPVVCIKVSALSENAVLEAVSNGANLLPESKHKWNRVQQRLDHLCHEASKLEVRLFIDAEESWLQDAIDELVHRMMHRYNQSSVTVYQTYQMYRHDRLAYLKKSHQHAKSAGFLLGAKLVRGAYLEKERKRAEELGYASPLHETKSATDHDYDEALLFCIEQYRQVSLCAATHNRASCERLAILIQEAGISRNHPHLNFCQLYGMGDDLTFNLAAYGFNATKYIVFGAIEEVFPYLVRRAEENDAVSGDFGREYTMRVKELQRRKRVQA